MRLWNLAALLLPLALPGASPAAQAPDARPDLAANAALKYWKAFALMPAIDKDQEKLFADWSKAPLDPPALKLVAASENSLIYLHRGAKLPRCDWSPDYGDGMELLLPHLAKARDLARLAGLHARHEIAEGRPESGVEDATSMLALARHVGSDPVMICLVVDHAIEAIAIELVASYLPELEGLSPKVISAYEALPPVASFPQIFRTEKRMVEWLIRKMKEAEAKKPGAWRDVWKSALGSEEIPTAVKQIDTLDQAVNLTEDLLPAYDRLTELVALPKAEFDRQFPGFKAKMKADNPLAGILLPAMDKVFATVHRNQAQVAMLKAATAVLQGGPGRLKDIKDPFGDGPFEYRALDKGFELKSKLIYQDQPVTLTVGQAKKR
jgi:hypothetical protein